MVKGKDNVAIAYLRVSTGKQGADGLGIEAQRAAVRAWTEQRGATVLREFIEVESGKRADRPQLSEALAHARRTRAVLVVAKLDRLTRDIGLLTTLQQSGGVRIAFCDLPEAEGAMGELLPLLMAWVGQLEARLISERTKAALAQAKVRLAREGKRLGNPNGARALRKYHAERAKLGRPHEGTVRAAELARQRLGDVAPVVREIQQGGFGTLREIAGELNRRGVTAPRGGAWHPASVRRVLAKLGGASASAQ